ncbi:hypothetical protein U0070_004135 [Myodes glareolus]|uniref:PPIase cyclophilin-type domain-containing protein n=1 Tax=Myodes glareolus TaxID=447135 RepID=A0AAW0K9P6_MYOGA
MVYCDTNHKRNGINSMSLISILMKRFTTEFFKGERFSTPGPIGQQSFPNHHQALWRMNNSSLGGCANVMQTRRIQERLNVFINGMLYELQRVHSVVTGPHVLGQDIYYVVENEPLAHISFELFVDTVPKAAENICILSTGEKVFSHKGSSFHRIISESKCQGDSHTITALPTSLSTRRRQKHEISSWKYAVSEIIFIENAESKKWLPNFYLDYQD